MRPTVNGTHVSLNLMLEQTRFSFIEGFTIALLISLLAGVCFVMVTKEYDCSDFNDSQMARIIFNMHDTDVYKLDRNKNGIPCEP